MSRGIKTFKVNPVKAATDQQYYETLLEIRSEHTLGNNDLQHDDIAVVEPLNLNETISIFKYDSGIDTFVLSTDNNFTFTDDTLTTNVTPVRKAHQDDYRTFINTIKYISSSRYGDTLTGIYNLSTAQLKWAKNTCKANMYITDDPSSYLTIRTSSALKIQNINNLYEYVDDIASFTTLDVNLYKPTIIGNTLNVNGIMTVTQPSTFNATSTFNGVVTVNANTSVSGNVNLTGPTSITGVTSINGNTSIIGSVSATGNTKIIGSLEVSEYIKGKSTSLSFSNVTGTAPFTVDSTTLVTNLNADSVDGLHINTGRNSVANSLVRTNASGYIDTQYININADKTDASEGGTPTHIAYQQDGDNYIRWKKVGSGGGINVDMVDGLHAGNADGNMPVSNGTLNTNLNADKLDGYHASNEGTSIPISNGTLNANLNSKYLEGKTLGNTPGQIPINNGTKCRDLNADMLDGLHLYDISSEIYGYIDTKDAQLATSLGPHFLDTPINIPSASGYSNSYSPYWFGVGVGGLPTTIKALILQLGRNAPLYANWVSDTGDTPGYWSYNNPSGIHIRRATYPSVKYFLNFASQGIFPVSGDDPTWGFEYKMDFDWIGGFDYAGNLMAGCTPDFTVIGYII